MIKSDFQKELLLLKALNEYLPNFQLFVFTCGTQVRYFISGKKNKTTSVKIYVCMFCLDVSYLANGTSSPSVKSIMLTVQYLKGTLYCNLPLSPSLCMHFSSCTNSIWPEHLRKTAKTENNFPFFKKVCLNKTRLTFSSAPTHELQRGQNSSPTEANGTLIIISRISFKLRKHIQSCTNCLFR